MTRRLRLILIVIALLGVAASAFGLAVLVSQQTQRFRGVVSGLPPANFPYRQPILGVNVELAQYDESDLEENLDLIQQAGFIWVRQVFDWSKIETTKGQYDWDVYDPIVEAVHHHNFRIVAVLWHSPSWAADHPTAPPDDMADFGAFAAALAQRYGELIDVYQIWDEPNLAGGWGDRPADPLQYTVMLEAGYKAIHRADSSALVLTAGLAPTIETADNINDVLYLRGLYANGAGKFFDAVSAKPYGYDTAPDDRQTNINLLNFSRILLLREEMERSGDQSKALWATQFGWNSLPAGWQGPPSIWGQVEPVDQANWTILAYERALSEWPWAGPLFVENWQPASPVTDPRWGFALRAPDGSMSLTEQAIAGKSQSINSVLWPGVYPATTPLVSYSGEWKFSESGADIGQRGDSAAQVSFVGSDLALILRRGNYRAYLFIMVDGAPSTALPRDQSGQSYVILSSPDSKPQIAAITIASGLDPHTEHRAYIKADRGWDQWALVGFVVGQRVDTFPYDIGVGAFAAAIGALMVGVVVLSRPFSWWHGFNAAARYVSERLTIGTHLALSVVVTGVAWLGMALTWSGSLPGLLRRLGEGPSLAITAMTAGVFFYSSSVFLAVAAILILFVLIYSRLFVGVTLIVFFSPYYLSTHSLFDRELSLFEVIALLTIAAWCLHMLARFNLERWTGWKALLNATTDIDRLVLAFVGLSIVALTWSELKQYAVTDLRQMVLEPFAIYLILRTTPLSEKERRWLVRAVVITAVIASLVGFYQFGVDWVNTPGSFTCLRSILITCNVAALFLERIIPICLAYALIDTDSARRWQFGSGGAIMLAATILTVSRGALLLGLPAAVAVVLITWAGRKGLLIVAAGIVLEIAAIIPLSMFVPRFGNMFDLSSGSSSSFFRLELWRSTLAMLRDHPLTGVGMDQFLYQYRGRYILPSAWQQPNLNQPHNFLLNYWVRLGILGLIVGIWLQVVFWKSSLALHRQLSGESRALLIGLMGSMAAMIAHGMVDETHFVIELASLFFLTLGLMHDLSKEVAYGNHDQ